MEAIEELADRLLHVHLKDVEAPDPGPVDEADARQIETHRAPGSKKIGAFALQEGGPLRDDPSFEPQRRPGA